MDENFQIGGSNFQFSGVGIGSLGASEYTLVAIMIDTSASVHAHEKEVSASVQRVVEACRKSPRADNLLLRVVTFDSKVNEFHGFKELMTCNPADYTFRCRGASTSLNDATFTGVGSVFDYGKKLFEDDYVANAIVFVITDGVDNASSLSAAAVGQKVTEVRTTECALESLRTVLIGVNVQDASVSRYLRQFETAAGFDQYVEVNNASASTLAKLADFVSQSISSQSQALGTGGPSQAILPASLGI